MRYTMMALIMGAMAGLSACDRPAPAETPASSAEATASTSPRKVVRYMPSSHVYPNAEFEAEELKALAAFPNVERVGIALRLKADTEVRATLSDTDGDTWQFVTRFEDKANRSYYVFRLLEENDSTQYSLIVDELGAPVDWVYEEVIVRAGPLIASGSANAGVEGSFAIDDWSGPQHVNYNFTAYCTPLRWVNAKEVTATCLSANDDHEVTSLRKMPDGSWQWPNGDKTEGKPTEALGDQGLNFAVQHGFMMSGKAASSN